MKKVIIYALSALVLAAFALLVYSAWWLDRTGKKYAPVHEYCSHCTLQLINFYNNECYAEMGSLVDCLREAKKHGLQGGYELFDLRFVFTPSDDIRQFGYLVANELRLYDQGDLPIFVCKTPLASLRVEEGEPPGKNHLAAFVEGGLRKITPAEFKSLDQSLYADVEVIIAELN